MRLIHVTDSRNLLGIEAKGLDPKKATGKRSAVWLLSPSNEPWGVAHTLGKPRARGRSINDHVVLVVDVPRSWLTRHARGVWYCSRAIAWERIREMRSAVECGRSYPGGER